jgi:hypothetical protein
MIDPPISPSERLTDALFQLSNAMGRLRDAFEILHCTLIVSSSASDVAQDQPASEKP